MSVSCARGPGAEAGHQLPLARWVCLTALLVAELLGLTFRFDFHSLISLPVWWAELLRYAPRVPHLAVVTAAAVLLFGGARLGEEFRRLTGETRSRSTWPFLIAHVAAFACLTWLTEFILEGPMSSAPGAGIWAVLWVGLASVTLVLWLAATLPINLLLPLLWRGLPMLGLGGAVGLAAWTAGLLTARLWEPLRAWTFWIVHALLGLVTTDRICDPRQSVVGTSSFAVEIAPACSGCEGVGLMLVFLGVYLWIGRKRLRFPAVLVLLPLGAVCIWLVNAVRITALIALGSWGSEAVALGGFHSQAGWLAFNAVALGTVVLSGRMRLFSNQPREREGVNPAMPYLAPLLVLLATSMIARTFSGDFDWAYPVRVVMTAAVLWHYRRRYANLGWSWSWGAFAVGGLTYFLWLVLEPVPSTAATTAFADTLATAPPGWAAAWIVLRIAGSVVTVPLAEELAFRGYLTRRLISPALEDVPVGQFTWFSFLVSSVLFGVLHGYWLSGTIAGALYALVLYRRRRLSDAVLAHATTNALLAGHVLLTGRWSLWC